MRDVKNWQRWAQESEIVWPRSISIADASMLHDPTMKRSRWVLKSYQSVGGQGVHDWPIDSASTSHRLADDSQNCYLQQKQEGTGVGVTFLTSDFGTILLGGAESGFEDTQRFMPKYTYRGSIGPYQWSETFLARLRSFGQRVGSEARILGLWQADFIVNPEFISLLEINPRWSASMELLDVAMEERLVGWHVACVNKSVELSEWHALSLRCDQRILAKPQQVYGKLIHYAPFDFVVSESQASQWWEVRWDSGKRLPAESAWFAADIPPANTQVTQGQPIRTSMIVGKTKEQVVAVGTQLSSNS
jgi:predicted ATP-grasp superfamily ATP-dependent carboligase